jgi:UDP-N-acetyl-D-glucosamine dehydrogenase
VADRFRVAEFDVAVVGLGYVGVNLALAAAAAGLTVAGVDRNDERVDQLRAGMTTVDGVEPDRLAEALRGGFHPSNDAEVIGRSDVVVVCVPTPLTTAGEPDHSAVLSAASLIGSHLRAGALVCVESTVAVGTTAGPVRDCLETGGRRLGSDYFLAFAPERINPGDPSSTVSTVPRVVGGVDLASTERAMEFYRKFVSDVTPVPSSREAELAKLLENTYRFVNLALINEIADSLAGSGIDLHSAIEAAATKPFGFQPFYPGPGIGGHCIPVDPLFLQASLRESGRRESTVLRSSELASMTNAVRIADRARERLAAAERPIAGARIGLLGVGYKAHVRDVRNSPAVAVGRILLEDGAQLTFYDDTVPSLTIGSSTLDRCPDARSLLATCDLVIRLQETSLDDHVELWTSDRVIDLRPGQRNTKAVNRAADDLGCVVAENRTEEALAGLQGR